MDQVKFNDLQMASIRHLIYSVNRGEAPVRHLSSFLLIRQDTEEQDDDQVADTLMQQMIGIMDL